MVSIISATGILIASTSYMLCTPMELTSSDKEEISDFAEKFLAETGRNSDVAEIEHQKCSYGGYQFPPKQQTIRTSLVALFAEQGTQPGESTRERVECHISRFNEDGSLRESVAKCEATVQRVLTYPGIAEPVRLYGDVSFVDARSLLQSLSVFIGRTVGGRCFEQSDFSRISYVHASSSSTDRTMYTVRSGDNPGEERSIRFVVNSDGSVKEL